MIEHRVTFHTTSRQSHFATCKCGWRSSINRQRALIEAEFTTHEEQS